MDPDYVDPPLGRPVTSSGMAAKVRHIDDPSDDRTDDPLSLLTLVPERPYWSEADALRKWELYYRDVDDFIAALAEYSALLIIGGSGPLVDLANSHRLHELVLRAGKPIAAECYGVACLAFARDLGERRSIVWGKHVTGHCKEYDYSDGTGFMESRGKVLDFNMGPPPYPLEYILRDSTGPDGGYHGNVGKETSVIVDFPFITGLSTPDANATGERIVDVLDHGLRRFGW